MMNFAQRPMWKGSKRNITRTRSVMRSTQTFSMRKLGGSEGTRYCFSLFWLCSWGSALFSRSINSIKYQKPQAKTITESRISNTSLKSCKSPFNLTLKPFRTIPYNSWKTTSWNLTQIKRWSASWRTIESRIRDSWRQWTSLRPESWTISHTNLYQKTSLSPIKTIWSQFTPCFQN